VDPIMTGRVPNAIVGWGLLAVDATPTTPAEGTGFAGATETVKLRH